MIEPGQNQTAFRTLAEETQPERIILFGSCARGDAWKDSDLDLLVIESEVADRGREMVRLRRGLRSLRLPVDLLVYSAADVARWGQESGGVFSCALRKGRTVYDAGTSRSDPWRSDRSPQPGAGYGPTDPATSSRPSGPGC